MKRLIPLILLALVLTACKIRIDVALEIAEDETGAFELAISLDQEMRDLLSQSGNDQPPIDDNLPEGWISEAFVDGEFEGTRATSTFSSFDDLSERLNDIVDDGFGNAATAPDFLSQLQLSREGDSFTFSADLTGLEEGLDTAIGGAAGDSGGVDPSAFLAELVDIRVVLTMPGDIVTSNADATAGSTLTWNLSVLDDGKTLTAESTTASPIEPSSVIPVIAVGLMIFAIVVIVRRRGSQRKTEMANAESAGSAGGTSLD